ncbi:MAG TPA: hypothetical protein GX687_04245 [Clostridia bacterium]|nr:hypothetical protein [Clostridia bacterium]
MLLSTYTVVALPCAQCGKMEMHFLSRFACGKKGQVELFCECGKRLMSLTRRARHLYYLQTACPVCTQGHLFEMRGQEIWNEQICFLVCEQTGIKLAYLGIKEKVQEAIKAEYLSLEEMIQGLQFEHYFLNPKIMFAVLEYLKDSMQEGRIYCSCGHDNFTTEIFAEHVELYCLHCQAVGIIFAETETDLLKLRTRKILELKAHSSCLLAEEEARGGRLKINRKSE